MATVDPLWFKDAVFYELHVKAFCDSNDDGIGDFRGLTQKLDYLEWLGVTCIWLLPFFPSPLRDDGYDVADYRGVFPDYGSLEDLRTFLHEAHRRGIRVIADLVLNHTSDQHAWFQEARRSPRVAPAQIITSGATVRKNMRRPESFLSIRSGPIGPGIPSRSSTIGIGFSATSRT